MRKVYNVFLAGMLCLFCNLFFASPTSAQVQTGRTVNISSNCQGFYEYLPQGYSSGNGKYPLLVFLHGIGEEGNGSTDLPRLLDNGSPPDLISQGKFPATFTVNGQTFSFIVISPQFIGWPQDADVDAMINYAISHYRVDTTRVYLTGLSMGGSAVWSYAPGHAQKLAGIVPIAGGQMYTGTYGAQELQANNIAVFAAANLNDPTVNSQLTVQDIQVINSVTPAITPPALDTIYNASGHGGWTITFDPNTNLHNGLNIYQYLLQFSRSSSQATVPLPVKLADFTATLQSGGTPQTELDWTTTFEQNNHYFLIQRSTDGQNFSVIDTVAAAANASNGHSYTYTDQHPLTGADYYRLAQVDLDGTTNYSEIREVFVQQQASTVTTAGLSLSPNPADAIVYLQLGDGVSGSVEVRLMDVQGRTLRNWVFQKPEGSWSQSLDVSGLPAGSYFIQALGTNYQAIKQFIKK